MKAIVTSHYGSPDGLKLQDIERPAPEEDETLIRVHAATVIAGDVMLRSLPLPVWVLLRLFMGLKRKRIPGHEFAGVVETVGRDVSRFKQGDAVFGTTTGLSVGANAEYVCLPANGMLAIKPAGVSYEEAAALPVGGMTALYFLRRGNIQEGQQALIYGASGSVGTFAVQLAKYFGAEVTGVSSAANLEMVASLGADTVIDYKKEDFTESDRRYDLIFDAVGKAPASECKAMLTPNGAFVSVRNGTAKESIEELVFLGELVEAGKLKPVIDRRYPLEETAEAHRYVETGRKRGNVVITVA